MFVIIFLKHNFHERAAPQMTRDHHAIDQFVPTVSDLVARMHSQLAQFHEVTLDVDERAVRAAELSSIRGELACTSEHSDFDGLAAKRDEVVAHQLDRVKLLLAQAVEGKSRLKMELTQLLEAASGLKSEAASNLASLRQAMGDIQDDTASQQVSEELWKDSQYTSKLVELRDAVDSAWKPLVGTLATLHSSEVSGETKEDKSGSFWMASQHSFNQLNSLVSLFPSYSNLLKALKNLREHEARGLTSLVRCLQRLERVLIPESVRKLSAESEAKVESASIVIRELEAELREISELDGRVTRARDWHKRYNDLLDLKESHAYKTLAFNSLKRKAAALQPKQVELQQKHAELVALEREIATLERPLLSEGARYVKLCPELTHSVEELKLLSGANSISLPVLRLEKDFDEVEDQRAILQQQSRHKLALVRPKRIEFAADFQLSKETKSALSPGTYVVKNFGALLDSKLMQLELMRTVNALQTVRHPNIIRLLSVVQSAELT
jgi:hypothetical protein